MKRLMLLATTLLCLLMPASALAYDPLSNACNASTDAKTSTTCDGTKPNGKSPISGPNGVLRRVSLVIAFIGSVAAVIVIVIAGLFFILANGDAQKAANARNAVIGAVIGLVIIVLSESLIIWIVSRV